MPSLAANAEMLYPHLPFAERVRRIAAAGFEVEMWGWAEKSASDLTVLRGLRDAGSRLALITGASEGNFFDPDASEAFLRSCAASLEFAAEFDVPRLCVHGSPLSADAAAGSGAASAAGSRAPSPAHTLADMTGRRWIHAHQTLTHLAALAEAADKTIVLENFNLTVDHPGTLFASIEATTTLVSAVGSPHLTLNLDLYHAAVDGGSLVQLIEQVHPLIGEVQIADVPGRCEPGTGEIRWEAIAQALQRVGYTGPIGLEARPQQPGDAGSEAALVAFSRAFAGFSEVPQV